MTFNSLSVTVLNLHTLVIQLAELRLMFIRFKADELYVARTQFKGD